MISVDVKADVKQEIKEVDFLLEVSSKLGTQCKTQGFS